MLDHEDLKWIATTSTELNSMLQQISRYSDLARQHKGEHNYIEMLGERVELASKTAQALFDRVTSAILAGSTGKPATPREQAHAPFTVVPPPPAFLPVEPRRSPPPPAMMPAIVAAPPPRSAHEQALPEIPADIRVLNPKGNRELILLVDDEMEISELASDMLAEEGYKIVLARDGFEPSGFISRSGGKSVS
jgi:CheY-like chemotaxis protein